MERLLFFRLNNKVIVQINKLLVIKFSFAQKNVPGFGREQMGTSYHLYQ